MRAKTISIGAAALALLAAGCGDDAPQTASTVTVATPPATTAAEAPATTTTAPEPPEAEEPAGPAETPNEDPRVNEVERAAGRTARHYVEALDARDGAAACALLAPGVIAQVELPESRADCAASLEASIGYRDPRGLPVWEGATVSTVRVSAIGEASATVVATVVTRFADRDEVSVEDDLIYLTRSGDRWLLAKPSATLYRAVGTSDVPPSALAPPR